MKIYFSLPLLDLQCNATLAYSDASAIVLNGVYSQESVYRSAALVLWKELHNYCYIINDMGITNLPLNMFICFIAAVREATVC